MKCLNPNTRVKHINGVDHKFRYPCGACDTCGRQKQSQWKARLLLESLEHQDISFVTFTYNDIHLTAKPEKEDAKRLIKRLRKEWHRKTKRHIRYYLVGEVGTRTGRAHYHAIIFGIPFTEQQTFETAWRENIGTKRKPIFASLGFIHAREFTAARAGYVVKYTTKFLRTPGTYAADSSPEFALMSRGTKRLGTKGIGLNGLSRIVDSVKRAKTASKSQLPNSEYFEQFIGSVRIGNSRCSLNPYLKSQVYKLLSEEEYKNYEDKLVKNGTEPALIDKLMVKYQRKKELRQAIRRTRTIPLTMEEQEEEHITTPEKTTEELEK